MIAGAVKENDQKMQMMILQQRNTDIVVVFFSAAMATSDECSKLFIAPVHIMFEHLFPIAFGELYCLSESRH